MITVAEINIAPVKSMALVPLTEARLDLGGIADDRRFYLVNSQGRLLSRRQVGKLAQLVTSWDAGTGKLRITFPDGRTLEGQRELDRPVWTIIWGRRVRARALMGDWMPAISEFCGQPALLMMSDLPCQVFDEFPVSVLSRASVEHLSSRMGLADDDCLATDRHHRPAPGHRRNRRRGGEVDPGLPFQRAGRVLRRVRYRGETGGGAGW